MKVFFTQPQELWYEDNYDLRFKDTTKNEQCYVKNDLKFKCEQKKLESSIEIIDLNMKRKMIRDVCVKRGVEFSTLFLANSCKYN